MVDRRREMMSAALIVSDEFWFLAAVASGLLSWGHLISSDYRQFDFTDTI